GRGLLLVGKGDGTLAPVPGQVSGIAVYGDQRGAAFADYDADGRLDLAVSQNGAETKLYHNEHARPGLRVRLVGPVENPHASGGAVRRGHLLGLPGPHGRRPALPRPEYLAQPVSRFAPLEA